MFWVSFFFLFFKAHTHSAAWRAARRQPGRRGVGKPKTLPGPRRLFGPSYAPLAQARPAAAADLPPPPALPLPAACDMVSACPWEAPWRRGAAAHSPTLSREEPTHLSHLHAAKSGSPPPRPASPVPARPPRFPPCDDTPTHRKRFSMRRQLNWTSCSNQERAKSASECKTRKSGGGWQDAL